MTNDARSRACEASVFRSLFRLPLCMLTENIMLRTIRKEGLALSPETMRSSSLHKTFFGADCGLHTIQTRNSKKFLRFNGGGV